MRARAAAIGVWALLLALVVVPVWLAALSPYLAFRDPIYIAAGFAGIAGLALLLVQPLLALRVLPGLSPKRARRLHRAGGMALLELVLAHVAGLWITSPPDVIDALTFTSPTPFSVCGVLAMWAVFGTAVLAWRRRAVAPRWWLRLHLGLGVPIAVGTCLHAWLILGAMEPTSKAVLCLAVVGATGWLVRMRLR